MSQDSGWSKDGYGLRTATCLKTVAGVRKSMVSGPLHVSRQWLEQGRLWCQDRYMSQDSGWSKEGYGLRTTTCLKAVAGVRKAMVSGPLHVSRQWLE